MTRHMRALAALVITILAACGGGGGAVVEPVAPARALTPVEVVEAGTAALEQYRQAYQVRSPDALKDIFEQTLDLVVIEQGKVYRGWTAFERRLNQLLSTATDIHLDLSDIAVVALGPDAAAASASIRREISDGVMTVVTNGTITLAMRRINDAVGERWVVVHAHFSYVAE
jgi:hypothetical protein